MQHCSLSNPEPPPDNRDQARQTTLYSSCRRQGTVRWVSECPRQMHRPRLCTQSARLQHCTQTYFSCLFWHGLILYYRLALDLQESSWSHSVLQTSSCLSLLWWLAGWASPGLDDASEHQLAAWSPAKLRHINKTTSTQTQTDQEKSPAKIKHSPDLHLNTVSKFGLA